MFGRSPQEKYRHYLKWFATHVADESNWAMLRADRDCCNWQDKEATPAPYEFGEALFRMGDPKKMAKALTKKVAANHAKYDEMGKYIGGDPKNGTVNPEYLARFETTKKLREQLKAYSGSDSFASDELFRIKQEADATGRDFLKVAADHMTAMSGANAEPSVIIQEPAKTPVKENSWINKMTWFGKYKAVDSAEEKQGK